MIEIKQLHKRFGPNEILKGISLSIGRGEVTVLLGPSGSGKSTLLRTINGLETFDAGEIVVGDIRLLPSPGKQRDQALLSIRQRIGMVFQQFHLFPHRTAVENVAEGPIFVLKQERSQALENAHGLLKQVGLSHKADAYPSSLSGGQQQRVAIARALAMNPDAILFDEPTSALDPKMTWEVTKVIADLARSGQTMVVVTHAMEFARSVAHRIHVLSGGSIVESGTPSEILDRPQSDAARELLRTQAP